MCIIFTEKIIERGLFKDGNKQKVGDLLGSPIALMTISVANANADTVNQDQLPTTVQTLPQQSSNVAATDNVEEKSVNVSQSEPVTSSANVDSEAPSSAISSTNIANSSSADQNTILNDNENTTTFAKPANYDEETASTQAFSPANSPDASFICSTIYLVVRN